jgi:methylmalonyl-CoA/ethylmalonyl-CoA epimerase
LATSGGADGALDLFVRGSRKRMERVDGNRLHHVGIVVRSIDDAKSYFVDQLRLRFVSDERVPAVGVRLAYFDAGTALLQLVEPIGPGPIQEHLEAHGEGIHHVCLAVADIEAEVARLAPGEPVRINVGGQGMRAAFLPSTPHGMRTELAEIGASGSIGATGASESREGAA